MSEGTTESVLYGGTSTARVRIHHLQPVSQARFIGLNPTPGLYFAPLARFAPMSLQQPKVGFVSLGCPKALVDSERIITQLRAEGYEMSRTHAGADLVIVNTCGFLDSSKEESLAAIGEAIAGGERRRDRRVAS